MRCVLFALLLLMPGVSRASDVFPEAMDDAPTVRNMDFLYDLVRTNSDAVTAATAANTYSLAPSSNVVFTNSATTTIGCDTGVPNSSVTIVTNGGKVEVDFQGHLYGYYIGTWSTVLVTMCMDGAEIPSFPKAFLDNRDSNYYLIAPVSRHFRLLTAPPAGTHSFYLATTIVNSPHASLNCTYGCTVEATEVR